MKNIFKIVFVLSLFAVAFNSCKEDEGENELHISFKTTTGYTYANQSLATDSSVLIGIEAETEKSQDPIIRFNISESVNGGATSSLYTEDLEATNYEKDFTYTLTDAVAGNVHTLTFTITNRDGLNKQSTLDITVE